jgi:hypothetical protein
MNDREITPEMARAELERREAARAELSKRQLSSSLTDKNKIQNSSFNPFPFMREGMGSAIQQLYNNPYTKNIREGIENTAMLGIPPLRAGKMIPGLGSIGEKAVNYGSDILQNAGIMGGLNALHGESPEQGAIAGGAATAAINPIIQALSSSNPLLRIGSAGALGAGAAYGLGSALGGENKYTDLAGALAGAGLAMRGKNAQNLVAHNMAKYIQPQEGKEAVEAAQRLGLSYITPAEATGNPLVAAIEGRFGRTPETSRLLLGKQNARLESENQAIDNLLDTIGTPKTTETAQQLYQSAQETYIPRKFVQNLRKNSIIAQALKDIKSNNTYKTELRGVKENSVQYLDILKRKLDDMIDKETNPITGKMSNEGRLVNEQRRKLVNELDKISPDYAKARELSERVITRRNIEEKIPNDEEIRGSDFYKKFLANQHKYKQLQRSLRNIPEAQQQLKDMKIAFKDLVNPTSVRTSKGMSEKSTSSRRVMSETIKDWMHALQGSHYDKAAVDLMTNPDWANLLHPAPQNVPTGWLSQQPQNLNNDELTRLISNILSRGTALPLSKI